MNKSEIQALQDRYNQWVKLLPQLEQHLALWKQANELLTPLAEFYGSPAWRELYDSFHEPLETEGNYSILSEDALWNALSDHRELYESMQTLLQQSVSAETDK